MTDLTEQWEKGELPAGCYYVKLNYNDTIIMADSWSDQTFTLDDHEYGIDEVKEVLAPVPTYHEYLALQSDSLAKNEFDNEIDELNDTIDKLKELLKECELWFTGVVANMNDKNVGEHNKNLPIGNFEHTFKVFSQKINQALGEE